jgi:DNA-binding transcriptional MerR regulator
MATLQGDRLLTITELAIELGVTARAIRFYESKGLIVPQRAGSNRVYTHRDRARLLLILRGKRLGFSLANIKEYLDLYDADPSHKGQIVHLLRGAHRRIAELERQRDDLETTLAELRDVERQCLDAMRQIGVDMRQALDAVRQSGVESAPARSNGRRPAARNGAGKRRTR